MKRNSLLIILFSFVLTACAAPTPVAVPSTPTPAVEATATATKTEKPTATAPATEIPATLTPKTPETIVNPEDPNAIYRLFTKEKDGIDGYFKTVTSEGGIPFAIGRKMPICKMNLFVENGVPGAGSIQSLAYGLDPANPLRSPDALKYNDFHSSTIKQNVLGLDPNNAVAPEKFGEFANSQIVKFTNNGKEYSFSTKNPECTNVFVRNQANVLNDFDSYSLTQLKGLNVRVLNSGLSPENAMTVSVVLDTPNSLNDFTKYDWRKLLLFPAVNLFYHQSTFDQQKPDAYFVDSAAIYAAKGNPPWIVVTTNP